MSFFGRIDKIYVLIWLAQAQISGQKISANLRFCYKNRFLNKETFYIMKKIITKELMQSYASCQNRQRNYD